MENLEALKYALALKQVKGIGDKTFKKLLPNTANAEQLFKLSKQTLIKEIGLPERLAQSIRDFDQWSMLEQELLLCKDNNIQLLMHDDVNYPNQLRHCDDGPGLIYVKGTLKNHHKKTIAIVGTRQSTDYGRRFVDALHEALKPYNLMIVSGMASGTDTNAHKAALRNQIDTVAVLAQGLCFEQAQYKRDLIEQILKKGAIISEYPCLMAPKKEHFPERNRIVAGMSHVTLVIESGVSGGSLITAKWANEYNRDVFALPGKANDVYSKGCNQLIRQNKAGIITNIQDLLFDIGLVNHKEIVQNQAFFKPSDLSEKALQIINAIEQGHTHIDCIHYATMIPVQQLSVELLQLEFKGWIKLLPGNQYQLMV